MFAGEQEIAAEVLAAEGDGDPELGGDQQTEVAVPADARDQDAALSLTKEATKRRSSFNEADRLATKRGEQIV